VTRIPNDGWDNQHSKSGSNAKSAQADLNEGCTRTGAASKPLYHRYCTIVEKWACIYTLNGTPLKAVDLDSFLHMEFTQNNKTWSDKPTSRHTTLYVEGLLKVEYKRNKLKSVKRTGPKTFQMKMKDDV
jgi:hypothetical protein